MHSDGSNFTTGVVELAVEELEALEEVLEDEEEEAEDVEEDDESVPEESEPPLQPSRHADVSSTAVILKRESAKSIIVLSEEKQGQPGGLQKCSGKFLAS